MRQHLLQGSFAWEFAELAMAMTKSRVEKDDELTISDKLLRSLNHEQLYSWRGRQGNLGSRPVLEVSYPIVHLEPRLREQISYVERFVAGARCTDLTPAFSCSTEVAFRSRLPTPLRAFPLKAFEQGQAVLTTADCWVLLFWLGLRR